MEQIKKIVVGPDPKNGMHWSVGQEVSRGDNEITKIEQTAPRTYRIWVKSTNGSQEVKIWREYEYMPVSIEYNLDYI